LSDPSFTPSVYELIAMDVNRDGAVSAGDVSQINQRSVLMIPEFKQAWNHNAAGVKTGADSKDWLFIDSTTAASSAAYHISAVYPLNDGLGFSKSRVPVVPFALAVPIANPLSCPLITAEAYQGVLLGDVNGNFASTSASTSAFKTSNTQKVVFDLANAVVKNGYLDVPVLVSSKENVNALDFALQFNEENLSFNSILDNTGKLEALSYFNAEDRTLRFTSNSLENYNVAQSVVTVRFSVNGSEVTASDLTSLKAYLNGEVVTAEVSEKLLGVKENANSTAVKVYPNPASNVLTVELSENGTVELFDLDGRQVLVNTFVNANQKQELNIQHIANGVYTLKIVNDNGVSMKKVKKISKTLLRH